MFGAVFGATLKIKIYQHVRFIYAKYFEISSVSATRALRKIILQIMHDLLGRYCTDKVAILKRFFKVNIELLSYKFCVTEFINILYQYYFGHCQMSEAYYTQEPQQRRKIV
jgi:hypothetical protein